MTIRRRFSLSFLGILTLFGVNVGVYAWSNQRRSAAVNELRQAIKRQVSLTSVQLTLNDAQKHVSLLSQVSTEAGAAGASAPEKAQFSSQLTEAETNITAFRQMLTQPSTTMTDFEASFGKLSRSWRIFFENFGVNQTKAIEELAVRAEPLSHHVIEELLPKLQAEENQRAETAGENFHRAARISDQITFGIFIASSLVALVLGYFVSRQITGGLTALKAGAMALGRGELGHRIELDTRDEMEDLGGAFNDMSGRLAKAREELTQAHELEKRKGEELSEALQQLKKAQDQLVVQQKMASLGTLTAGIAHEIKNPLNFVTNFAEISTSLVTDVRDSLTSQKDRIDPKEFDFIADTLSDLDQNVAKIREHGKRADGIVKGMLMHSRGQRGQHQPANLNSMVAEYVKLAYHGIRAQDINFNVTIEESYDPAIGNVDMVAHDLSRAILNIANNACYAAYAKAKSAGPDFKPTLRVSTSNGNGQAEIRIRDNGDGIPENIRQKIFEPFFTTKPAGSGTGLGLSMTYDIIVQEHKGQLRVDSQPGQYAEFIITIPRK